MKITYLNRNICSKRKYQIKDQRPDLARWLCFCKTRFLRNQSPYETWEPRRITAGILGAFPGELPVMLPMLFHPHSSPYHSTYRGFSPSIRGFFRASWLEGRFWLAECGHQHCHRFQCQDTITARKQRASVVSVTQGDPELFAILLQTTSHYQRLFNNWLVIRNAPEWGNEPSHKLIYIYTVYIYEYLGFRNPHFLWAVRWNKSSEKSLLVSFAEALVCKKYLELISRN